MNHCIVILLKSLWTGKLPKKCWYFFNKKNPERLGDSNIPKNPCDSLLVWLCNIQLVKISKMGCRGGEAPKPFQRPGVDWHPWGSLFPTMKTWLSFYTSHIVFLGFCGPIESTMCVFQNVVTVTELKRPWEVHLTYSPLTSRIPHECVNVSKLVDPATPTIVYFYQQYW